MTTPPTVWKPAVIKRRLRQLEERIQALCQDLEAIEKKIPVPTLRELQCFERRATAFSPESVLFGVVRHSHSSLLQTLILLSDMVSIPPEELRRLGLSPEERTIVLDEIRAAHKKLRSKDKKRGAF